MKKIKYFLALFLITGLLSSCFDKIDNWYTNTSKYDGRYVVGTVCEEDDDYNVDIKYGYELWITNSAANIEDEIIIDTHVAIIVTEEKDGDFEVAEIEDTGYAIKGKFKITGDPSRFQGGGIVPNLYSNSELTDGEYYLMIDGHYYDPSDLEDDDVGEEFDAIHLYARLSMEEGKITPQGAKTIGGNTSDAVSMKITTYCDYLVVESYTTPQVDWSDPAVPEYAWRVKEGSRKNADGWEEHWTLDGYRYTGFPEDNPNIKPPIIEK
jgi:hypothetical protein